ncbi:IS3 family transposase [Thioalkalivibrio sp. ALJ16]|uniref:IS3 family transposase n=1 Tax=Thioalkalivibrio sp. ALJ16 TaxID=1158762 RepID=UPI00037D46C5|nr:IS3 family transposase [Thioalkalivibrio sp. ALJ16]
MHRCITTLTEKASVQRVCDLLEENRAGYYAARARAERPSVPCAAGAHLERVFAASGRTYGSRRLAKALQADGTAVGRYRVRTLMRERGLRPVWRRRFVATTQRDDRVPVAENHLNRKFTPAGPNQAWASDITYIPTATGWSYLAVILDLYSRKVIGWALDRQMPASQTCEALRMALEQRQPEPGLLLHSDQGCQYTSAAWRRLLARHRIQASMSRRGNCWDNAVVECFFLSLKTERVWQRRYANHGEARRDFADYIARFYNTVRIHSTLGYLPSSDYEHPTAANPPNAVSGMT